MRGFAFRFVTTVSAWLINAIGTVANALLGVIGRFSYALMRLIDAKTLALYEDALSPEGMGELEQQNLELRLLASAQQVRDHAKHNDDWTASHTEALNAIGQALVTEAGWEEDSVHVYLKELVESIDGLEYGTED